LTRLIPLEGAYNFRDLGGLACGGGRCVAKGLVFRSDRLSRLTAADLSLLRELKIGSVFDLRSQAELAADTQCEFGIGSPFHRHLPLVEVSLHPGDQTIDWKKIDLQNRYLEMLEQGAHAIRALIEHLADDKAPPTVFHCTGGKDRTGVVAAVLLRALGVPDEIIVEDYAQSERNLEPLHATYRDELMAGGLDPAAVLYLFGSPPERMVHMLTGMDVRWRSAEGYLAEIGVRAETLARLRRRLVG